ncbi:MAG: SH3 domain-containing protein [Caldilineaceae bacterium]|nr:SH3 domain-containing protein [Caldilineaceae bacterium]
MDRQKDKTSAVPLIALFLALPVLVAGIVLANWISNPQVDSLNTRVAELTEEIATLQPTATRRPPTATPPRPTTAPSLAIPNLIVITGAANVRKGPGLNHEVIDVVTQGQKLRGPYSTQKGWKQVCCVDGGKRGWISGELVQVYDPSNSVAVASNPTDTPTRPPSKPDAPSSPITSPPPSLSADPIYTKYLDAAGAHILATEDVFDYKLQEAKDILLAMTSTRPELFAAMTRTGLKIIIFNHRNQSLSQLPELAGWQPIAVHDGVFLFTAAGYTIVVPEFDLKCSTLLAHEIGHAIEEAIRPGAPWFVEQRDSAYQNAMAAGIWTGEYAATNKHEYWAVAVERHFRLQAGQTPIWQKDPAIAQLVVNVFGDAKLPPCPARNRY